MKGRLISWIAMIAILTPALSYGKQLEFSVKPGFGIQSSHLGVSMGRITPYFGLDVLSIGVKANYNDVDWQEDWATGSLYKSHEGNMDISGSATLLIPHFGLKFHLADQSKKLRPYLLGDFFKAFAFVNVNGTEVDRYYDPDGGLSSENTSKYELEENEEEFVEGLLGVWGFIVAFGADYSFSEHFSIGGEYGFRLFFSSGDYKDRDSADWDDDGIDDWRSEWDSELSGTLKLSYAAIALNFNF